MRSIERQLLGWILGALALGTVLVAGVTYRVTLEEMNEVFDGNLKGVAEAMATYERAGHRGGEVGPLVLPQRSDEPEDIEVVTLTWSRDGRRRYASDPRVKVPFTDREGLAHISVGDEAWIVYTSVWSDGVAQAAQRVWQRRQMAGESALQLLLPMAVLMGVVAALLVVGLRRGMRPLHAAARDIAARSARSLEPIGTEHTPQEITPLVSSINALLARLATAFTAQRQFLADAAHELRTPVTALRLQAQLLRRETDPAARAGRLDDLDAGIERSQHLVEQLLQVARAEPDGETLRDEAVDLGALARSVVGRFSALAEHRGIDLGADGPAGVVVRGDPEQLTVLLNNLVENALRYTPRGGVVDVAALCEHGACQLRVVDDGPGIDAAERERVFERFHRGPTGRTRDSGGSGLGLAIVRAIAERHHASVQLLDAPGGHGLDVRVRFAAAPPAR